jgi:NADH-quinone oxidoreductase subunit J
MLDSLLFYFFAGLAIIGAILLVALRNPIHSAVCLILTLLATAGIFLQLHAEFLFIAQIILYVGGLVLLFIFVILLLPLFCGCAGARRSNRRHVLGLAPYSRAGSVRSRIRARRPTAAQLRSPRANSFRQLSASI